MRTDARQKSQLIGSGFWLACAELCRSDVGPRMAVRSRRVYSGRSGESQGGVDLRSAQGLHPFLAIGDAPVLAVGDGEQALWRSASA